MLFHRKRPVIGLQHPQHHIELRHEFAVQLTVFIVAANTLPHTGQIHQCQVMTAEAQAHTLWLPGAGFHGIHRTDFATEQRITQRGFSDAGFAHNANHGFVCDELVEFLEKMLTQGAGIASQMATDKGIARRMFHISLGIIKWPSRVDGLTEVNGKEFIGVIYI